MVILLFSISEIILILLFLNVKMNKMKFITMQII
jgi:hypothetical protein